MDKVDVRIIDATNNKEQEASLPVDATIKRIIKKLVEMMGLPKESPDGKELSYFFINEKSGQRLSGVQTLDEVGINEDDAIILKSYDQYSYGKANHIFVAMPYGEEMLDVFEFGICEPIIAAGFECERCDRSVYTGNVMERIKERIASSLLVIADLTFSNPNVYLEVGYAWGKEVPTLLIAKSGQELIFDVKTYRCVYYTNIADLRKKLTTLIPDLISRNYTNQVN